MRRLITMGCCSSRLVEAQESVSRCKVRRRYMKQLVKARQSFSFSHSLYVHSLRSTGSALLQFASAEAHYYQAQAHHHHIQSPSPRVPSSKPQLPPPPPLSPCPSTWTNSSVTASPILPPPPPPPPHSWDFWDPFAPSSSHFVTEEEWDEVASTNLSEAAPPPPPPPSVSVPPSPKENDLAVIVAPKSRKDLAEVVKELDEYFLKAADAGERVSALLEAPSCVISSNEGGVMDKIGSYGRSLRPWGSSDSRASSGGLTRFQRSEEISVTHSSTVERLYAWEKKLYLEVKSCERMREEHEKRVNLLRKQELKGVDYMKVEKNKRAIESLESKMMVATQSMEATTSEITRLRESELFPQLLHLVNGLMGMWRNMYECHQVQTHIVQQLSYLTASPLSSPTSDMHRQATLQLELEVDRWYSSFCNLVKSQREYIHSLTGWLRLSLFQSYHHLEPLSKAQLPSTSNIYSTCEEWYLALDQIPDKVASEGIKSFLTVIHAIVLQQGEEQKQKKRSESASKELDKRVNELRSLESKYGPYSSTERYGDFSTQSTLVMEKRVKVDCLKLKADDEKAKYEKSSGMTRAMTVNNLQTGFPTVFQALTGFSSVCMQAFEAVLNHHQRTTSQLNLKLLT